MAFSEAHPWAGLGVGEGSLGTLFSSPLSSVNRISQ